jgi:hypothetical protein
MLTRQLADSDRYKVIQSEALDKTLKEQLFSNGDRNDVAAAAKAAALVGADAIIVGEISLVRGSVEPGPSKTLNTSSTFTVQVTARLVQANTGEVLTSAAGSASVTLRDPPSAIVPSASENNPIDLAAQKAVGQLATNLIKDAPLVRSGFIADVSGENVILNIGTDESLKVGDSVSVSRASRSLNDPATGSRFNPVEQMGTVKITDVDPGSSSGTFSGRGVLKVGDSVRVLVPPTVQHTSSAGLPFPPPPIQPTKPVPPESSATSLPKPQLPEQPAEAHGGNTVPSLPPQTSSKPTAAAPPSAEYALGDELANWKKALKTGAVEYRVPRQMTAAIPSTVTINLHGYQDTETKSLPDASGTGTLKVSSYMKAELFAPLDPGEFTISQKSGDSIQFVPNDGYATWMWTVTPANAAPSEVLQIRISLVHKNGTSQIDDILEEKTYNVTVNVQKLGVTLRQSFWKDPIAWFKYMLPGGAGWGALAALFAWVGGLAWWKNKKKRTKMPSSRKSNQASSS